jgi:predicted anti-sigma-YlaC factor YlaD
MLTCREMSEVASEVIEGRARRRDRVAARLHLLMCRLCREYFRQLRVTIATIRRVRPPEVTVNPDQVLDKIERAGRG